MRSERTSIRSWFRWLVPVMVMWLLTGCILVLELWPNLPSNRKQWVLLLVLGPPLYVLGEAGDAWLSASAHRFSGKRFSLARIAFALPIASAWFVLCWLFASLIGSQP